jgi:hypothetical protein
MVTYMKEVAKVRDALDISDPDDLVFWSSTLTVSFAVGRRAYRR